MRVKAKQQKPSARTRATSSTRGASHQTTRLWLMFPPRKIRQPVIWELAQKFKVITNIRQASITDELGIVCLELEGPGAQIQAAIQWLGKSGITVEPIEIGVLES